MSAPVLLAASSAAALEITLDQITGTAGGAALGAVGGPVGGLIGGLIGKAIGRKIHPPPRQIDLTDLRSRPRVTPIQEPRLIDPPVNDRVVDSTPVRTLELRPTEAEAGATVASAPAAPSEVNSVGARAIPAADVGDNRGAPPGTLDYQLNQLRAARAEPAGDTARLQTVAAPR